MTNLIDASRAYEANSTAFSASSIHDGKASENSFPQKRPLSCGKASHLPYESSRLNPICYTDYASFSYRLDGNNVDVDTEGVYLAKNQITYQGLDLCISQEFKNLQMVMK